MVLITSAKLHLLHLPITKSSVGQSSFQYAAASEWNNLPRALRELKTLSQLKTVVFTYFIELDRKDHMYVVYDKC